MTPEQQQYIDYAWSFASPVEADFFKPDHLKQLDAERAKSDTSRDFVAAIIEKDDFEERIQQAVAQGKIYSASQMHLVNERLEALQESSGAKMDVQESLVAPTGQRVIMSNRLAYILGFYTDGYMLKDEQAELISAMQADGIPGPEVDKVTAAMNKYGAIALQKGVFAVLKSILEDALGRTLSTYNKSAGYNPPSAQAMPAPKPAPGAAPVQHSDQLPFSFVEYLRNTDKEFDRVEHEIVNDPMFKEFFAGLQKQYAYYQNLPVERMAGEMIVRPQLWAKLSPQTKVWVQNIVNRNREEFQAKVGQVAQSVHSEKLDELKQSLGK